MIKFEKGKVSGWETAIRSMRNPMNSWEKSDSHMCDILFEIDKENYKWRCAGCKNEFYGRPDCYVIGDNDLKLMRSLANAGPDHSKFARWINVTVDITAPLYWWKEFETYRAGVKRGDTDADLMDIEMNSCSTMHKIHEKEFALDDFSHEHLIDEQGLFADIITDLNSWREDYLRTKNKIYWWQMIQLLPSSYNQLRTVKTSYQALSNMYFARRNHKLDEWIKFCNWVEKLPYFKEIYLDGKKEKDIRAKWITQVGGGGFKEWTELKCSNCRGVLRKDEDFKKYKYCPFCGAKMED